MKEEISVFKITFCFIFSIMILIAFLGFMLTSCCTLSFSNVMTSGTASDVVDDDEQIRSSPDISPTLNFR